jgi:glutathione S-transferase
MVLKIYGSSLSTCTRRVATVLKEKEVPYEIISIDYAKGQHKSAEHREKQPFGQIPYIVSILGQFQYHFTVIKPLG